MLNAVDQYLEGRGMRITMGRLWIQALFMRPRRQDHDEPFYRRSFLSLAEPENGCLPMNYVLHLASTRIYPRRFMTPCEQFGCGHDSRARLRFRSIAEMNMGQPCSLHL